MDEMTERLRLQGAEDEGPASSLAGDALSCARNLHFSGGSRFGKGLVSWGNFVFEPVTFADRVQSLAALSRPRQQLWALPYKKVEIDGETFWSTVDLPERVDVEELVEENGGLETIEAWEGDFSCMAEKMVEAMQLDSPTDDVRRRPVYSLEGEAKPIFEVRKGCSVFLMSKYECKMELGAECRAPNPGTLWHSEAPWRLMGVVDARS